MHGICVAKIVFFSDATHCCLIDTCVSEAPTIFLFRAEECQRPILYIYPSVWLIPWPSCLTNSTFVMNPQVQHSCQKNPFLRLSTFFFFVGIMGAQYQGRNT
jgi:hypothetical protein